MTDSTQNSSEEENDPFAGLDAAAGMDKIVDPYPTFHEMREECPVLKGKQWHRFGMEQLEDLLVGDAPVATVLPFEEVYQVLRDPKTFSNSAYIATNSVIMGDTIIAMDDPEHRRHRALVQKAFVPRAMQRWEPEIIRPVVNRYIDAFVDRGQVDLVPEFCMFPIHVIAELLGLPEEDLPAFHRKAIELISILTDVELAMAASVWLYEYFEPLIEQRRTEPQDDLITLLVQAELDGERLDNEEIIAFLRQLLPAGAETTYRATSNLIFGLLSHPDQLEAVRNDPSLIPGAVEEALRWEAPLTSVSRHATGSKELAGVEIVEGTHVRACLASANRDPSRWENPDDFNIFREERHNHLAFGIGSHVCLGAHLARAEMVVAVEELLRRLPNLRLDPEAAEGAHVAGLGLRSANRLPVLWDVEA